MMKEDIYYKLKNSKLGIKPSNNNEGNELVKIFKEHNLIYIDDEDNVADVIKDKFLYIEHKEWFYGDEDVAKDMEVISYKEFIDNYFLENINSDKKDLIRILIDEYLLENEISIQEELILKRFGDFCKERL